MSWKNSGEDIRSWRSGHNGSFYDVTDEEESPLISGKVSGSMNGEAFYRDYSNGSFVEYFLRNGKKVTIPDD